MALTVELAILGVSGLFGLGDADYIGPLTLAPPAGVLLLVLSLACAVLTIAILGGLRLAVRAYTRARARAPRVAEEGPIRELLAERVGDRTLSIAYWLGDREEFVDELGRPVQLPGPGSGRAWTAVDHDGRRVAAIIHDAELDTTPELVNAAAAAAALALDNERLKADLRARVEDLRISRARIVEAADAARRRLERDLHDGAQQQLVSLALDLRLLRARLKGTDLVPMVEELSDKLAVALAELRELARGIHPAILTDRGLGPAVQGLADRVPLPVEVDVELEERPAAQIEAAAYFVTAEALTNVARYARASEARVRDPAHGRRRRGGRLRRRRRRRRHRRRHRVARPPGPARRARRAAVDQQPARRGHATTGGDPGVIRLAACLLATPLLAGCGGSRETREPDVVVRGCHAGRGAARPRATPGRVSIWVVTHGQASSAFWTIVRNGVDAASRQADVQVTYRSPDVYDVGTMAS